MYLKIKMTLIALMFLGSPNPKIILDYSIYTNLFPSRALTFFALNTAAMDR
jgi:hypothetical protein